MPVNDCCGQRPITFSGSLYLKTKELPADQADSLRRDALRTVQNGMVIGNDVLCLSVPKGGDERLKAFGRQLAFRAPVIFNPHRMAEGALFTRGIQLKHHWQARPEAGEEVLRPETSVH